MTNYFAKDGRYFLAGENDKPDIELTNVEIKLEEELKVVHPEGGHTINLRFSALVPDGESVEHTMPFSEFEKFDWVSDGLGIGAKINTIDLPRQKVIAHIKAAVQQFNPSVARRTVYARTGFIEELPGRWEYLFANGKISADGVSYGENSLLHGKFAYCQLPENYNSGKTDVRSSIQSVFGLLDLSKNNPYIGLVPCLAPIRAVVSRLLPIDSWFFIVGRTGTFKTSVTLLTMSFFGPAEKEHLISWNSTEYALTELMLIAQNGILAVDDFVYNPASGKDRDFTDKADTCLRACANGTYRSRKSIETSSVENKPRLNSMLVATGEFAPTGVQESIHARGIYVPVGPEDIQSKQLSKFQEMARNGDFGKVMVEFIRYFLKRRSKFTKEIEAWKEEFKKKVIALSDSNSNRDLEQIVGMLIAWKIFLRFATHKNAITKEDSSKYGQIVLRRLVELQQCQREIYAPSLGTIFLESLEVALKDGRGHLIDHKHGGAPRCDLTASMGWKGGKPKGKHLGWYNVKKDIVYVSSDVEVEELIELVPLHYQHLFRKSKPAFWKQLVKEGLVVPSENGRNGSRDKLHGTEKNHYRLIMSLVR